MKLYAVLQGSVNAVVTELIRAELARQAPAAQGRTYEDVAAELLARFGVDPRGPDHLAAAERPRESVQREGAATTDRGAA